MCACRFRRRRPQKRCDRNAQSTDPNTRPVSGKAEAIVSAAGQSLLSAVAVVFEVVPVQKKVGRGN